MKSLLDSRWFRNAAASLGLLSCGASPAWAVDGPSAADALKLQPTQAEIDFSQPTADEVKDCTVKTIDESEARGWIVLDGDGLILRRFIDTNGDNKLDRWCYYQNGVEVFRDIDNNFNGVADQHRWLGTAGIRWGIDSDEDGEIDSWRAISAEEVTSEIVAALRNNDEKRFTRLLITESELSQLGVGKSQIEDLKNKVSAAKKEFAGFAREQDKVRRETRWLHFGGTRPGVIPAGTEDSTKDITVYDNIVAIIETNGKQGQIAIGSLFQVGEKWRAIELPEIVVEGQVATNGGIFSQASMTRIPDETQGSLPDGITETTQKLLEQYDEVDRELGKARSPSEIAKLNDQRANLLIQLTKATPSAEEKMNWIRQCADTVSGAFQTGEYPDGLAKLEQFQKDLARDGIGREAIAYVAYRHMNAKYTQDIQGSDADLAEIQEAWLKQLSEFVKTYPTSEHAPEAISQLALAEEFAGEEKKAIEWYRQIVTNFPDSPMAEKARGAERRLTAVGKPLRIQGKTIDGKTIDTGAYRNRVVLVHYWASWCDLCKQDFETLKNIQAKYARRGLTIVGANLDMDESTAGTEIRSQQLPWQQLYAEGGLDGRLANELGIVTLPTMILIDSQGRVVSRNITAGELDGELRKLIK